MSDKKYWVLAYYIFTPIEDPQLEIKKHKEFFKTQDAKGRIYINEEGINGQMSASVESAQQYMTWLKSDPRFSNIEFKIHEYDDQAFEKMTVKYRKQLAALDVKVDVARTAAHVSPEDWAQMIEHKDPDTILIDVRNDYETAIGHFEGSIKPSLKTFREFPAYAESLTKQYDPEKTKIMMCCTGGIRCEIYSVLMKDVGFKNVYQLDGGIIKYGLKMGSKHWKGKLFVFDDRLAVPISPDNQEVISQCKFCDTKTDVYYNCANMDCNELFLCCKACAEKYIGCCCEECTKAPRVRAFEKSERPKPFRKVRGEAG